MNAIYFKYYLRNAFYNFSGMFVIYALLRLLMGGFDFRETLYFAFLWAILYALFDIIYYILHLRKLGLTDLSAEKLANQLVVEKASPTDRERLPAKLNTHINNRQWKLSEWNGDLILNSGNRLLSWGDPILVRESGLREDKTVYILTALQKDRNDLGAYYKNIRNLNYLKNLI